MQDWLLTTKDKKAPIKHSEPHYTLSFKINQWKHTTYTLQSEENNQGECWKVIPAEHHSFSEFYGTILANSWAYKVELQEACEFTALSLNSGGTLTLQ